VTAGLSHLIAAASPSATASPLATPSALPSIVPSLPIPSATASPATLASPNLPELLLSGIVWIPLIAALLILLLPARTDAERARIRIGALAGSGFVLVLALLMWYGFADQGGVLAYEEQRAWLPQVGSSYHLGVDGVSMALLLLTSLLSFTAVMASTRVRERAGPYFALLLLLETGLNGVLASADYLLLLLFWALPMVAAFFLIAGWGGHRRAAYKALAFGLTSTALLILAVLVLATHSSPPTLDLAALHNATLHGAYTGLVFWLFFLGFALLLPVAPLHTWLVDAVAEASPPVAALIGGAIPVLGGYGLYRTVLGEFPGELHRMRGAVLALALATLVWSGLAALGQDDLKRAVALLGVNRSSLVLLAVVSAAPVALNGGVVLMFASGLGVALLLLTAGVVQDRTGTSSIRALGGLAARLPRAAILYLTGGFGLLGLPGLAGFTGTLLVFLGAYSVDRTSTTIAILASLLLAGGLVVSTSERIFFGPLPEAFARLRDLGTLELTYAVLLAAVMVLLGLLPTLLVNDVNFGILSLLARGA
jgi:NADH-quinone oxidoreductase subunit M